MKSIADLPSKSFKAPISTTVDIDGMRWWTHGHVETGIPCAELDDAPVAAEWKGEWYRAFAGALWTRKIVDTTEGKQPLAAKEIPFRGFPEGTRGRQQSQEQWAMEPGRAASLTERARRTPDFKQYAAGKRSAMERSLVIGGWVWERTTGPKLLVRHLGSASDRVSFEFMSAQYLPALHESHCRHAYSAFDAERVIQSYSERFEPVEVIGTAPSIKTEEGWSRHFLQEFMNRRVLEANALSMGGKMHNLPLSGTGRELLLAHARLRSVLEGKQDAMEIAEAAREMLRVLEPQRTKHLIKCWRAAIETASYAGAAPAPELDGFSL